MADTQNFDKLNILKRRSIPYEEYFGDMELTEKQKKNRMPCESGAFSSDKYMAVFSQCNRKYDRICAIIST